MNINYKLLYILSIILIIYIIDTRYELFIFVNPIYSFIITILLSILIISILLKKRENFKNVPEGVFTGIKGRTTMNNLQSLQDNEIQNLESQVKLVKSFLQNKNTEIENQKFRKIPINNSCITLNSEGNTNLSSKPVPVNQNTRLTTATDLNKNEFMDIIDNLKDSN